MREIHPAAHVAHGWREFLVHIATIAIGLLLALGLEKLGEYLHYRNQLASARIELAAEAEHNLKIIDDNLKEARRMADAMDSNLKVVRSSSHSFRPDALNFAWHFY